MITRDPISEPRIKNKKIALIILNSKLLTFIIRNIIGLSSLINHISSGKTVTFKFPKMRLKLLLSQFLKDIPFKEVYKKPITKGDIFKTIDEISINIKNSQPFFGKEMLNHVREVYKKKSIFNKNYFNLFLKETLKNEINREFTNNKLAAITIDINTICNQHCVHCFASSSNDETELVDITLIKLFILS